METIKKIVITGPESTGKSTLCEKLAAHYNTLWVPEFAREYLEKNGAEYRYEDLLKIAKGQIELEEKISNEQWAIRNGQSAISNEQWAISNQTSTINHQQSTINPQPSTFNNQLSTLFIDTDMYVMKVWSEFVFNKCDNWILNRIAERKYDLYLLCDVDLPWVEDRLREYPDQKIRKKLFYYYKDLMVNQSTHWCIISGNYADRFEKAVKVIESLFTKRTVQK